MKTFFVVLSSVCLVISTSSQQVKNKPLQWGDKVPELSLGKIYDAQTGKIAAAKLSDYSGQLVILDFWNTACAACINAWPKLEKLQNKFNGKVKILLINPEEDLSVIKKMLDRRKKLAAHELKLPIAYDNLFLKESFVYSSVPNYVWIGADRIIKAVTSTDQLTEDKINQVLLGNDNTGIEQKKADLLDFNSSQSFFEQKLVTQSSPALTYSIVTKANPDFKPAEGYSIRQDSPGSATIYFINTSISNLYQLAYRTKEYLSMPHSRTVLQVKDSTRYLSRVNGNDNWPHLYCYQLVVPGKKAAASDWYRLMLQDLDRAFGVTSTIEKRVRKCLVVYATDTSLIMSKPGIETVEYTPFSLKMQHSSVAKFIFMLHNILLYNSPYPFADETNFTGLMHLDLEANMFNWESIDKALRKYGMGMRLEDREIEVLVIKEQSN